VNGFWRGLWAVTVRNLCVWRSVALASVAGNFGEPILYLLAMGFGLGRVVPQLGGMSYAEFIAPGLVVSTVMYTATFEMTYGSYTRLTSQGVWNAILATPVSIGELCAGELVWGGVKSLMGASAVLVVVTAFGLVPSPLAALVAPLGFTAGVMFAAMALAVTTFAASYEFFNYYFTLAVAPMFLFSGIFFPLDGMPAWVTVFAQALPLTHVVAVSRGLVRGAVDARVAAHFAAMLAFTAAACALAAFGMHRRLRG
jgi:lipooligosaccharide transport system permease protein